MTSEKQQSGSITINIPSEQWDILKARWSELGFKSPRACEDFLTGFLINEAMGVCASFIRRWENLDLRFFGVCDSEFYEDEEQRG